MTTAQHKAEATAESTDEAYLVLLTIDHPSFSAPLRFVNDQVNQASGGSLTAQDLTANNYDGTLSSLNLWSRGILDPDGGAGLQWPGFDTSKFVSLPNGALNGLGDFTFEALMQPTGDKSTDVTLVSGANSGSFNEFVVFLFSTTEGLDSIRVYVRGGNVAWTPADGIPRLDDGTPRRLSVVRFAGTGNVVIRLTERGQPATSYPSKNPGTGTFNIDVDPGGLFLGQEQDSLGGGFQESQSYEGLMDDVRFWAETRDATEVQNLAWVTLTGSETNLQAYWPMNEANIYLAWPFEPLLPSQERTRPPRALIRLANTDRRITEEIRNLPVTPRPTVTMQVVRGSDPHTIERAFPEMDVTKVTYNAATVEAELSLVPLEQEPFPALRFTPGNFPGIFQ